MPYGYRLQDGALVENPDEADVVRRIFRLRRQGKGARVIARTLTEGGVPTRSGKLWNPATVAGILDNPRYRGLVDYLFGAKGLARGWGVERVLRPGAQPAIVGRPKAKASA